MKRAIVTGGAGFIGSNLVDALVDRGFSILVVDNLSSGRLENLEQARRLAEQKKLDFWFEEIDILDPNLTKLFQDFKPDLVCHLAAQIDVRKSVSDPVYDSQRNVSGTVNVLSSAKVSGAKKFVFASTGGAIYGEQDYYPADEAHPTKPESPYGVSKRAAEVYLEYFSRQGIECVSLRFSNVYGPRQNPHGEAGVVSIFGERLAKGEEIFVYGDGNQTRDFIHVSDIVNAFIVVTHENHGQGSFAVFNVGTGIENTVNDIVKIVNKVYEEDSSKKSIQKPQIAYKDARPGEQFRSVISAKLLETSTTWTSKVVFAEGIAETLKTFLI